MDVMLNQAWTIRNDMKSNSPALYNAKGIAKVPTPRVAVVRLTIDELIDPGAKSPA
jgi:hypothetical protein